MLKINIQSCDTDQSMIDVDWIMQWRESHFEFGKECSRSAEEVRYERINENKVGDFVDSLIMKYKLRLEKNNNANNVAKIDAIARKEVATLYKLGLVEPGDVAAEIEKHKIAHYRSKD